MCGSFKRVSILMFSSRNSACIYLQSIHASCSVCLIRLHLIARMLSVEEYNPLSSSLSSIIQPSVSSTYIITSSLAPFSRPHSVYFFCNMTHQISLPHKTTSKIIILHFSVVVLWHNKKDEKIFWTEWLLETLMF